MSAGHLYAPHRASEPTLHPNEENGVYYPDTDGKPMAENTLQYDWISLLVLALKTHFADDTVFVAGDLLWYPVEGRRDITAAPDAMVVFGRQRGPRRSYKQWRELDLPPQVVFEVLSHSNTAAEMAAKRAWYHRYGVEELYVIDPVEIQHTDYHWQAGLQVLRRGPDDFHEVEFEESFVSPRLGFRFVQSGDELKIYKPNGEQVQFPAVKMVEDEKALLRASETISQLAGTNAQLGAVKNQLIHANDQLLGANAELRQQLAAKDRAVEAKGHEREQRDEAARAKLRAAGLDPKDFDL